MRHRRRVHRKTAPTISNRGSRSPGKGNPITSVLKNVDLAGLSGQLHGIADHMERFSQFSGLINGGILGGLRGGKGINFMNLLKNGDSLNNIVQAFSPILKDSVSTEEKKGEPKKVSPISVKTRSSK